ncbi:MAG TPA: lysylphosphatidylglycerol synthase transmembrane domain-containing protein [Ilumatobacteraceae bacterium]|nr:lysylphosphatidylglycerol synthase transmembrane domain-containing protein [Ilumatobacteraceae bacterium]
MVDIPAKSATTFVVSEPHEPDYVRSWVPAVRLLGALVVLTFTYVALQGESDGQFAAGFGDFLASIPRWLVSGIVSVCQIAFLVAAILGFISQLVLRHFVRVGRMLFAAAICALGLVAMAKLVGSSTLPLMPPRNAPEGAGFEVTGLSGYGIGASFPTTLDLGVIAAWMFIDRGHWSERWRWIGRLVLVLGIVARLGVSLADPATIITAIAMASAAACVVQLILGVRNSIPRAVAVGMILERLDYKVSAVERFGGFHGFAGFRVYLADGRQLIVKVISRDLWASLLPVQMYRAARFRDIGQDRPFRSLRSAVEHEALCALKAHSDGVPTARLAMIAEFPPNAMMMAFDTLPRQSLSELDPSRRTPELLASVWAIVDALQRSHTVHRRLNADALWVEDDGTVVLVGFAAASLGVVGSALSTDVAEVLAATSAPLGVARAVEAAVAGVGADAVAAALPRLQPLALTPRTRAAVKSAGCLDDLRHEIERVTGADNVPIADLQRIKTSTVITIAVVALALWSLIPQFLGVGSLWGELLNADWWWVAAALGLSAVTYVGAALALDGSVADRLPLGPNIGVQVATSFVGVAAPGGGLALTARFLQKRGVDTATAVGAVGVDTIAGVMVHLTLTGLFIALAGSSGLKTFDLPSMVTIGLIAAGVAAVAAGGVAVPWSRALLTTRVWPAAKRSLANVGEVAHQPTKMIELFGGCLVITMGYILALQASVLAFDTGPAFTSVALVYLVGSMVSSVAPTPGGIGAVEATLIAGLTAAGMDSTTAVAAVILFRLATFWIPLVPGYGALVIMQRSGDL